MAISVSNWVWNHSRSRHGARLVLLAIADCAREDGTAWPSVPELKRKTGLGERAVQAAIIDCSKLGELEVGYQQGPKGCNRYKVLMPKTPAESAGGPQEVRGAEFAGGSRSSQVNPEDPADIADPAESAPPQNSTPDPAESADGTVKEPPLKTSRRRDLNADREDIRRLCAHLADRVEGNTGERPSIGKKWLDAARLMLDSDGRTEKQVHTAIDWALSHEFWRSNILSMPKLREQYLTLQEQAKRKSNGHPGQPPPPQNGQRISPRDEHRMRK